MTTTISADNGSVSGSAGLKSSADSSGILALQTGANTTAVTIDASQNTTFVGYINTPNTFGFKNRIINGAMMIDQRNAGASVTASAAGGFTYTLDRWAYYAGQASKFTLQQSTTSPSNYKNSLAITSSSSYSVGSGDIFVIEQPIEGLNVSDFGWGTASAATVTLSFWVRSSLTGTFGGSILNSASNRSYPFSYTVSAANTWEQKSITIAGDTSGTWLTTNGVGIYLSIGLGVGSTYSGTAGSWSGSQYWSATGATSVVGTSGATFYITGVQLEKGSTATSFDYRPYGTEFSLCQNYYKTMYVAVNNATDNYSSYPISMRATPTVAGGGTGFNYASSNATAVNCFQTTRALQTLTLTSEL